MADLRTEIRRLVAGAGGDVVRAAVALRHAPADQVLERLRELGAAVDAFERGEPAPPRRAPRRQAGKRAAGARSSTPGGSADAARAAAAPDRGVTPEDTNSAEPPGDSTDAPVLQELEPEPEPSSVRAAPAPQLSARERIKAKLREALERRAQEAAG